MTGTVCSVASCKSNARLVKLKGLNIKFFSFPKDPKIKKEWMKSCHRIGKWTPENKRICSRHFTEDDYEDLIKAKLTNTLPKKLLRDAVPSLHLLPESESPMVLNNEVIYLEEQETKFERSVSPVVESFNFPMDEEEVMIQVVSNSDIYEKEFNALVEENQKLKKQIEENACKYQTLEKRVSDLEKLLQDKTEKLEAQIKNVMSHFPTKKDVTLRKKRKAR